MYRIAILDEFDDDIERFQLYVHRNDKEKRFEVIPLSPQSNFEETLQEIFSSNLDALVSDYRLNEYKANITYDGIRIVNAVLERKADFPCFVLTSFDDDAVKDSDDGNIVYIKGIMNGESNAKITFLERIEKQIQKYKFRMNEANQKLQELLAIKNNRLFNPKEEEEYIKISHFLDISTVGQEGIPRTFFTQDTNKRLDEIILKTDKLLRSLNLDDDNA